MRTMHAMGAGLLMLAAAMSPIQAQVGQSGLAFLKLGVSGRGMAMADAMSGIVSGAASTYYNPAGILGTPGGPRNAELMFMHKEWIQDTRMEFLGASIPLDDENALGAMVSTTTVSNIEVRLRPGPADGTFSSRDLAVGLSYARLITPELRVGVSGKFLYEKIYVDDATGFAFDVGGLWSTPVQNLTIGASVADIGSMSALNNAKTTLPSLVRIGPAYHITFNESQIEVVGAADYVRVFPERRNYLNAGGEFTFMRIVSARAGYQFGSDGRGLTAGIGLCYGRLTLDYAYAKLALDLGSGHALSLALSL